MSGTKTYEVSGITPLATQAAVAGVNVAANLGLFNELFYVFCLWLRW
jgi:hypothetical protein